LRWLGRALAVLGVFLPPTEASRALAVGAEAVALARAAGGDNDVAMAESYCGFSLLYRGESPAAARTHLDEALRLLRQLGADMEMMDVLGSLATLAQREGQHLEARQLWHEARQIGEALGERGNTAMGCCAL